MSRKQIVRYRRSSCQRQEGRCIYRRDPDGVGRLQVFCSELSHLASRSAKLHCTAEHLWHSATVAAMTQRTSRQLAIGATRGGIGARWRRTRSSTSATCSAECVGASGTIAACTRRGCFLRHCRKLISDRCDGSSSMIADDAIVNLGVELSAIAQRIVVLRGQRVLLDTDLARLYGVAVRRLNEQVRRNYKRFPDSFVFHLKFNELRMNGSQIATSSKKYRGPRCSPLAFTEHGAIMAATVLNSPRAMEMSVYVVRAFVKLREIAGIECGACTKA